MGVVIEGPGRGALQLSQALLRLLPWGSLRVGVYPPFLYLFPSCTLVLSVLSVYSCVPLSSFSRE